MVVEKRLVAAVVAACAFAGAVATTASATTATKVVSAADAKADQVLSFYNQALDETVDACYPGPPVTTTPQVNDGCQHWVPVPASQGYLIESAYPSVPTLCIKAPSQVGQLATMAPCNAADPSQQWNFPRIGSDQVFIALAGDNTQVLGSTTPGYQLELEELTGAANQRWTQTPPV